MKKVFKMFAIAAIATIGLASCQKDGGEKVYDGDVAVTLNISGATTKLMEGGAVDQKAIDIENGYIVFTTAADAALKVIEILKTGTTNYDLAQITATDLKAGATIPNITQDAKKVYVIANVPATMAAPTIGASMPTYMAATTVSVVDEGRYEFVTVSGSGNIAMKAADPAEQEAEITLSTILSRIELTEFTHSTDVEFDKISGVFINKFYDPNPISGAAGTLNSSTNKADYVKGAGIFTDARETFVYDYNATAANGVADVDAGSYTPAGGKDVWAYNVFAGNIPQVVIRFEKVTLYKGVADKEVTYQPGFVTINGFRDKTDKTPVGNLAGGNVYKVADAINLKPEHFGPNPGVELMTVDVSIVQAKWTVNEIEPIM